MSQVGRDHPGYEPLLLTAWAKNLATSAVWEATAKKPTSSANAHVSAARAVGSLQRATAINGRGESASIDKHPIDWQIVSEEELAAQAVLLRDIFGNPFHPVALHSAWLTQDVVKLAESVYSGQDFNALPILADALEEAGCDNADLLNHCRGRGPHVRGCWVVGCFLGKE
jgi:hypothetical protein